MTWFATAIIGSAVIGGIASNSAAQTQADASTQAAQIQQNMFNQTVANEQPYVQAGYGAQNYLDFLLGIPGSYGNSAPQGGYNNSYGGPGGYLQTTGQNGVGGPGGFMGGPRLQAGDNGPQATNVGMVGGGMPAAPTGAASNAGGYGSLLQPFTLDTFRQYSPAYKFQLQQGQQGILNGDESSMGALSGAAQKDLIGFNQGLAQDAFTNAFNQYQTQQGNIYGRLAGIANQGQAAASNSATGGSSYANSIGANVANAGTARAGGIVGAANSLSSIGSLPWLNAGSAGSFTPATWDASQTGAIQGLSNISAGGL